MAFARNSFGRRAPALLPRVWTRTLLLGVLAFSSAAPLRAEPFRFPWDPPPPTRRAEPMPQYAPPTERRPLESGRISTREVREVLEREGVQMVGKPRAIRDELIVLGRDSYGMTQKYILDAISGEVLAVRAVAQPERPQRRDEDRGRDGIEMGPLGDPLPQPVHASPLGDDRIETPPLAAPPPSPVASTPPPASRAAAPPPVAASAPNPSDAALSPIRPLRPPGAPKVEPLPQ